MATTSPRARACLRLSGLVQRLPQRLAGLHRAVWLGLLDADDLNQITLSQYSTLSGFGDAEWNISQGL